ncbi:unnamed protein product [Dicrocoelium dendriticum]|nr:unnamed protein product [Dicrocoelium dendriticum]
MCSKRRIDLADPHFAHIHNEMGILAEYSRADAKSFLLLIRSLMPNSFKLKLIEYEFARDNSDPATAAQHLSQLASSHIELLQDEINNLFKKIASPSPDRVSIDIFSRLSSNAQHEIIRVYVESYSHHLAKANMLLSLLSIREIRASTQLTPWLLTWTYECLREGERLLLSSSSPDTRSTHSHQRSPVVSSEAASALISPNLGAKRGIADDESEEGEVVGDDEDEEEDLSDFKTNVAGCQPPPDKNLAINIYRLKMAYELLPIIHKVYGQVKIDSRFLEGVITYSLSFLVNFLLFYPESSSVLGTDEAIGNLLKVHPREYIAVCLYFLSDLLKWSRTIFTAPDAPTAFESHGYTLKTSKELLNILLQCIDELSDYEATSRRRRPAGRKSESHHATTRALSFQAASLFWYIYITLATEHLFKDKPGMHENMSAASVSSYPLNVSTLFSNHVVKVEQISSDNTTSPLLLLACLLRHRKYDVQSRRYSLGQKDLDKLVAKIGPSDSCNRLSGTVSLEKLVELELALVGLLELPALHISNSDAFAHAYPEVDRSFLRWISCACSKNIFSIKALERCDQQRIYFLQNFSVIRQLAPDDNTYFPSFMDHDIWLIPLTLRAVEYFGCRIVAHWLECVLQKKCGVSEECRLNAACFIVVLCQIDSVKGYGSLFTRSYPLPCNEVLIMLRDNWSRARLRLYPWLIGSPEVFSDASLLNQLVQFEASYRSVHQDVEHPDFSDACVRCIRSSISIPISTRLSSFVQSESPTIFSCLNYIE